MYYDFAVVVPAGTKEATPVEQTLKLTKGIIHRVEVEFPGGCKGYVSLVILHEEHQLYPTDPDGVFNSNGYTIPIDDYFPLDTAPYELKAKGWSPNAVYDHTITVRIGVLPEELLSPLTGISGMFKKFFKLIGLGG